jgi:hypothetical protein
MALDVEQAKQAITRMGDENFPADSEDLAEQLSSQNGVQVELVDFFERLGPSIEIQSKDQAISLIEQSSGRTSPMDMLDDDEED